MSDVCADYAHKHNLLQPYLSIFLSLSLSRIHTHTPFFKQMICLSSLFCICIIAVAREIANLMNSLLDSQIIDNVSS